MAKRTFKTISEAVQYALKVTERKRKEWKQ